MNAVWMASTVPPMPTFSPSWVQLAVTWLGSDGLWEIPPAAAIWADHDRAMDVSWLWGVSVWMPRPDRNELVRLRKRASALPVSAWAAGAAATARPARTVSAASHDAITRTSFTLTCEGSDGCGVALTGRAPNGSRALVTAASPAVSVCRQ